MVDSRRGLKRTWVDSNEQAGPSSTPSSKNKPTLAEKGTQIVLKLLLNQYTNEKRNVKRTIKKIDRQTVSPSYNLSKLLFTINSSRRQVRAR